MKSFFTSMNILCCTIISCTCRFGLTRDWRSFTARLRLRVNLRSYSELGYAYLRNKNEEDAVQTFEKGIAVNPKEAYFYRSLGYIYLRRGDGNSAAGRAYGYLRVKGWRDEHSPYIAKSFILFYLLVRQ